MIAKRRSRRDPESGGQSVCHNTCLPICLPREAPIADLISSATTDRDTHFLGTTLARLSILPKELCIGIPRAKQAWNRHPSYTLLL
jgi:hypothetical protein